VDSSRRAAKATHREGLRRGENRGWYIRSLGFTSLEVASVELRYKLTQNTLLAPVYKFKGRWALECSGLNASGELEGLIIAITARRQQPPTLDTSRH